MANSKSKKKPLPKLALAAPTSAVANVVDAAVPLPTPIIVVHGIPARSLLDLYLTMPDPAYTLSRGGFPFHKSSAAKNYDPLPFHPDSAPSLPSTSRRALQGVQGVRLRGSGLCVSARRTSACKQEATGWAWGSVLGLASLHSFLPKMAAVQQIMIGFLRVDPPNFKAKPHSAPGVAPQNVTWPAGWCVAP